MTAEQRIVTVQEAAMVAVEHHLRQSDMGSTYCGSCGDSWPCVEFRLAYTVQVQAEQIAAAYSYAQMGATTAHAQGLFEIEHRWLDLLHMLDQSGVES